MESVSFSPIRWVRIKLNNKTSSQNVVVDIYLQIFVKHSPPYSILVLSLWYFQKNEFKWRFRCTCKYMYLYWTVQKKFLWICFHQNVLKFMNLPIDVSRIGAKKKVGRLCSYGIFFEFINWNQTIKYRHNIQCESQSSI